MITGWEGVKYGKVGGWNRVVQGLYTCWFPMTGDEEVVHAAFSDDSLVCGRETPPTMSARRTGVVYDHLTCSDCYKECQNRSME